MNARKAYLILVHGKLKKDGRWKNIYEKHAAIYSPISMLQSSKIFNEKELKTIISARNYNKEIKTKIIDGTICFDSIYDLMLHFEIDLGMGLEGFPLSYYRGQRLHQWLLVPSLYRKPELIEEEIEKTIQIISGYINKEQNLANYEPLEIIAIAQHYGAKTCFLDFTHNFRNAAVFACFGYKLKIEKEYGVIYRISKHEAKEYVSDFNIMTGGLISLDLPDIPRIRLQEGIFFGAFNKQAFKNVLGTERYLFCHSKDSLTFPSDVGLSYEYLFPKEMQSPQPGQIELNNGKNKAQLLSEIKYILTEWSHKLLSKMDWNDYYTIALSYSDRNKMNHHQLKRLRVFCRWFADIQSIPLPVSITSLRRLRWAVQDIQYYYDTSDETEDIITRLNYLHDLETIRKIKRSLTRARRLECYDKKSDGLYF